MTAIPVADSFVRQIDVSNNEQFLSSTPIQLVVRSSAENAFDLVTNFRCAAAG